MNEKSVIRRYRWQIVTASIMCLQLGGPQTLVGQSPAKLDQRVSSPLREAVEAILDSAVAVGLPTAPLADKALEGISKGADNERVLAAVRLLWGHLQTAKRALGTVTPSELEAGASALRAGVPVGTLTTVHRALPKRSLVIPYAVLSTMVRKGIPVSDAAKAVIAHAKKADDQTLLALSTAVDRNLAAGLPARTALVRAEGMIFDIGNQRTGKKIRP